MGGWTGGKWLARSGGRSGAFDPILHIFTAPQPIWDTGYAALNGPAEASGLFAIWQWRSNRIEYVVFERSQRSLLVCISFSTASVIWKDLLPEWSSLNADKKKVYACQADTSLLHLHQDELLVARGSSALAWMRAEAIEL